MYQKQKGINKMLNCFVEKFVEMVILSSIHLYQVFVSICPSYISVKHLGKECQG